MMTRRNGLASFLSLLFLAFALNVAADVTAAFTTDYDPDDPAGRVPLTVNFADLSETDDDTDPIVSWFWEFGDGSTSTDQNPVHTYVDLGYYDVSLEVTAQSGDDDTQNENDYVAVYGIDMAFVLDQSGSMSGDKLSTLKDATQAFNNLLDTHNTLGDEAAVVSYESRAHVKYAIHIMQSGSNVSAMQNTIDNLQATGVTALYKGCQYGAAQLANADQNNPEVFSLDKPAGMLLMSDGLNNASGLGDFDNFYTFIAVHALGFGADCNPTPMIQLANMSGGSYHFASTSNLNTIMSDIYQAIKGVQRSDDYRGLIVLMHEDFSREFYVDPLSRNLIVNTDWFGETTDMTMTLTSPSGKIFDYDPLQNEYKSVQTETQCAFKILNPEPGTWKADISAFKPSHDSVEYCFWTLSASSLALDLDFVNTILQPGEPIKIRASLTNGGAVPAATMEYIVEDPNGRIVTIDESSSAAFGMAEYTETMTPGNYIITAIATGTDDFPFKRIIREAVWVEGGDTVMDTEVAPEPVTEYAITNNPNPFNPETSINFSLPQASDVNITIYNMLGQKVKTLVDEPMDAGTHSRVWNGKDDQGRSVGSGIYLYRMKADNFQQTKRMLLLK